jgi:hypothetical protein
MKRMRKNPDGSTLMKASVAAGAVYLAWRWLSGGSKVTSQPTSVMQAASNVNGSKANGSPATSALPKGVDVPQSSSSPSTATVSAEICGDPTEYEVATTIEASGMKGLGALGDHRADGRGIFSGTLFS